METWAKNNYEPTLDEIHELLDDLVEMTTRDDDTDYGPPAHGRIQIVPAMERYIWMIEGVFWSRRRISEDGHVWYDWVRP